MTTRRKKSRQQQPSVNTNPWRILQILKDHPGWQRDILWKVWKDKYGPILTEKGSDRVQSGANSLYSDYPWLCEARRRESDNLYEWRFTGGVTQQEAPDPEPLRIHIPANISTMIIEVDR